MNVLRTQVKALNSLNVQIQEKTTRSLAIDSYLSKVSSEVAETEREIAALLTPEPSAASGSTAVAPAAPAVLCKACQDEERIHRQVLEDRKSRLRRLRHIQQEKGGKSHALL